MQSTMQAKFLSIVYSFENLCVPYLSPPPVCDVVCNQRSKETSSLECANDCPFIRNILHEGFVQDSLLLCKLALLAIP